MSYTAELDAQWKTFLDLVETRIRSLLGDRHVLRSADYEPLVRVALKRWQEPTQLPGAWLARVGRAYPDTAAAMRAELGRIRMTEREFQVGPPRKWSLGTAGVLTFATVALLRRLKLGLLGQIAGGIGVLVIVSPLIDSRWETLRRQRADAAIAAIRAELEICGTRLRQMLQEAEAAAPRVKSM